MKKLKKYIQRATEKMRKDFSNVLVNTSGEGFVDTAVKILISIVIGALLLAGLYTLFGDTILPTLTDRINEMFNYEG